MKQVFFETFGCQMNVADTDRMELILFHSGYRRTQEKEDADLILVNTCSIREKAEQKTFSLFGGLKPLKTNNPDLILGLTGCMGQQDGENMWRVHWFYKACNVDEAVRKRASTAIKEDKDLFYSLHEDLLSDETFCGVVKVVAVGSAYRTLLPGEFVCKFVYDVKGDQLHRITDKRLVGKLQKELQKVLRPLVQRHLSMDSR